MMRRSKPQAYLLLGRVSNLPTVWTNALAGATLTGVVLHVGPMVLMALALSCIYCGGMWMNDACDAIPDAAARTDRPIPSGDVTLREVWIGTGVLWALGLALLWFSGARATAWLWTSVLLAAIVDYNVRHKFDSLGPLAMGICRGTLYLIAAAVVGTLSIVVGVGAIVLAFYVLSLTFVGKTLGPRAGHVMPWLIAGISLIDAVVIITMAPAREWLWVIAAAAGFIATLTTQRVVSGT